MPHGSLLDLNASKTVSKVGTVSLLSLPNEIIDQIIRIVLGDPALTLSRYHSLEINQSFRNIRLVNHRLAALGSYYCLFKHRCTSERQLEHETSCLSEGEILKRRYTRQLEVTRVPVVHWLSTLQNLYPCVTHLSLTRVRLSAMGSESAQSPSLVLPAVKHLSILVDNYNEKCLPGFLHAFPNLVTLVLDGDSTRGYHGMDSRILLSIPPLPHLKTLYRPPLKRTHLVFSINYGHSYIMQHQHSDFVFNEHCNECQRWKRQAETTEKITATQLQWHFPSLREVLVRRLVFEDWMPIPCPPSDQNSTVPQSSQKPEGLDLIEFLAQQSDVMIWRLDPDSHTDCTIDCVLKERKYALKMATQILEITPSVSTGSISAAGKFDVAPSSRPQFHVLSPKEYNLHSLCKRGKAPALVRDDPKFWWAAEDRMGHGLAPNQSSAPGAKNISPPRLRRNETTALQNSRAVLVGPWDL